MNQTFHTVEETAEQLKVSKMTIYRHIKAGKLIAHKVGKDYRISQADLDAFLAAIRTNKTQQ